MSEKMLVTQALDERDLLVKKISDKIDKASFVDTIKPNEDKVYSKRIGKDEYAKEAESAYQQKAMIYITGDTHGDMNRIVRFCERMETSQEDIMIILGDVGLNYYGDSRDRRNKEKVANLPITLFCIHGNHERRPTTIVEYKLQEWNGGKVWVEEAYPNILFAKDGEIYDIAGMKTIVIGGAYSVDKFYRLSKGYNWFEDEQPSDEIKAYVEKQLSTWKWRNKNETRNYR